MLTLTQGKTGRRSGVAHGRLCGHLNAIQLQPEMAVGRAPPGTDFAYPALAHIYECDAAEVLDALRTPLVVDWWC
jgi:hypothetical protein